MEHGHGCMSTDESVPAERHELADGDTGPGHHEPLAQVELSHDLTAVVAQLPLGDFSGHASSVARRATLLATRPTGIVIAGAAIPPRHGLTLGLRSSLTHDLVRGDSVTTGPTCASMKHMSEVGIRALKQNASAVVSEAAAGETVTITDRGRPVAQMTAIPVSRLRALVDAGRARRARRSMSDLPAPKPGPDVSAVLSDMRDAESH